MEAHPSSQVPLLWHCKWNWCPEAFRRRSDLMEHLLQIHFSSILRVKKRDWDTYMRSTQGQSGATDSILGAIPSYPQSILPSNPIGPSPPRTMPPPSATSPPKSQPATSELLRTPPPDLLSSTSFQPPAKRRRRSFASYTEQSSPMSSPSIPSIPPSPALANMVADAINRAGQNNARSPGNASHRSPSICVSNNSAKLGIVPPLPRTNGGQTSPSPSHPSVLPQLTVPTSPTTRPRPEASIARSANSIASSSGSGSATSAWAVEEALTQNAAVSPTLSQINSRASSRGRRSGNHSPGHKSGSHSSSQDSSQPQGQSYCGSHAVESNLEYPSPDTPTEPLAEVPVVEVEREHAQDRQLKSEPAQALRPLPRTRRAGSKLAAAAVPPTRTLRSRSKTPAPAPAPAPAPVPVLPRRTTRSRTPSVSNANGGAPQKETGKRAASKPPESQTRRAGSRQPSVGSETGAVAGGRKGRRAHPGGLTAVDEQPDESAPAPAPVPEPQSHEHEADVQIGTQAQVQRPTRGAFRSGTLQLPRRNRLSSQSQTGTQVRSQVEAFVAAAAVKDEPLDVQPPPAVPASDDSQSRSQGESQESAGGYREGYGFNLDPRDLLTQKPYPSHSQDNAWSP